VLNLTLKRLYVIYAGEHTFHMGKEHTGISSIALAGVLQTYSISSSP